MLKNHLIVAIRNLARRGGTTAVNVVGLGLACGVALLLGLVVQELRTFDRGYPGSDDVHLVLHDIVTSEGTRRVTDTWAPLWPAIEAEVPAVEAGTRVLWREHEVEAGGRAFAEQRVSYADAGYFRVFPFPFLRGAPETAFAEPDAAVISPAVADAYFGDADPVGRTLVLDGAHAVTVTGVVEHPRNTSVSFDVLVHWPHAERHVDHARLNAASWNSSFLGTYLRLRPGADVDAVNADLAALLARHRPPDEARIALTNLAAWGAEQYGFGTFAAVFIVLALGVLLMAAANFTNLATARSLERAREIGVRKTLGAGRGGIAVGFFVEAGLVATAAVLLGVGIAQGSAPWVNGLLDGAPLAIDLDFGDLRLWGALAGLAVLVTVLAGAYPAVFLTRFQPAGVLKGYAAQPGGRRLRGGLVVFQFALAVLLLSTAFTIHRQVRHLGALGFDFGETPVVVVPLSSDAFADREAGAHALRTLRDDLRRHAAVAEASISWSIPGAYYNSSTLRVGAAERRIDARAAYVDPHYFDLYGIDLVAGSGFESSAVSEGERPVIVNRAALAAAGWESFEGKTLRAGDDAVWNVVGVTDDFAFRSLREPLGPAVHILSPDLAFGYLSVRSATADPSPVLDLLAARWPETGATRALTTSFADERYAREALGQETALRGLVAYVALFAALIALIGLAGLAALAAVQRTKEIGVRKALGATTPQVVLLLTRQFAGLVLVASLLAAPPALLAASAWLAQYPYRIEAGPGPILLVAAAVLVVAAAAVALQTLRIAATDPVDALRYE